MEKLICPSCGNFSVIVEKSVSPEYLINRCIGNKRQELIIDGKRIIKDVKCRFKEFERV